MPILTVEIVTRPDEQLPSSPAKQLVDNLGEVLAPEPGGTWVRLYAIPADRYAEGPGGSGDFFSVFVTVLGAHLPATDVLKDEVSRLTEVIARVCDRPPENVHLHYLPPGAGRVAFGGRLVTG